VPIYTPPVRPPDADTDPLDLVNIAGNYGPVYASFNCFAPRGRGQGICLATPATTCNDSGCHAHEDMRFRLIAIVLRDGNDSATLLPGTSTAVVSSGAGNDTRDVRNGAVDYVDCGDGSDSVAADKNDNVNPNCEAVTRGRP
jgi:hypothetical protein